MKKDITIKKHGLYYVEELHKNDKLSKISNNNDLLDDSVGNANVWNEVTHSWNTKKEQL